MQGRTFITAATSQSYVIYNLTPTFFGDRSINMADMYAEWRPVSITFSSIPKATTPGVFCLGVSYPPEGISALPTTMDEMVDFPAFAMGNGSYGCPYPKITVGKAFFANTPLRWYNTQPTTTDPTFEYAGNLVIGQPDGPNDTINHRVLVEWELEFRSMLDPAISMQRMIATYQERKEADFPPLKEEDEPVLIPQTSLNYAKALATGQPLAAARVNPLAFGRQTSAGTKYNLSAGP